MTKGKKWGVVLYVLLGIAVVLFLLATTQIKEKKYFPLETDQNVQILFMGDSNLAYDFEGISIPAIFDMVETFSIYNIAIGGTCAAKLNTEGNPDRQNDLFGFYHLSKIAKTGYCNPINATEDDRDGVILRKVECLAQIDMQKMDYIVISYGINDFMAAVSPEGESKYDETTYAGALRSGIRNLQEVTDATIIISSITYVTNLKEDGTYGNGYELDYGVGTIKDYRDAAEKVAGEFENVIFFDALSEMGIDESNNEQYMRDIIHFNQRGRELYADALMKLIEEN